MNPCSRLRGIRFGWYVRFGTAASPRDPAGALARRPCRRDQNAPRRSGARGDRVPL